MPSADLGLSRGGKGESEMADVMIGILRLMFQVMVRVVSSPPARGFSKTNTAVRLAAST